VTFNAPLFSKLWDQPRIFYLKMHCNAWQTAFGFHLRFCYYKNRTLIDSLKVM